ncbi:type II secretion system F family protein [Thermovenabulum sp.]|uniref:type II secretion system F family protein n=2 Tax=Thermovenabulum sp. TaxID=3100335 RepID=UPI003C7A9EE0
MLLFISMTVFLFIQLLAIEFARKFYEPQIYIQKRLYQMAAEKGEVNLRQAELSLPLFKRIVEPMAAKISGIFNKQGLQKIIFSALASLLFYIFFKTLGAVDYKVLFFTVSGGMIGYFVPDMILDMKKRKVKEDIEKSLPEVLDLLTVCVEAGLGFDGALAKVVEKTKGVLSKEFSGVLNEVRMGRPRKEALRNMADRLSVDELSNFVGSLIMAEQLGISIGNVLRLQSREIRAKRRQKVEEMAMKAPVKMLIPIILFIFPAIFIVLLAPAVFHIMKAFMN